MFSVRTSQEGGDAPATPKRGRCPLPNLFTNRGSYLTLAKQFFRARSRKRRARLPAVPSTAIVNTDLNPRGSVLANGELWNAQTLHGNSIARQTKVTIVGFHNHVLLVENNS